MNKFEILAYDKDADVYDTVCTVQSKTLAERVAVSIQKIINKGVYRRHANGEPYDWMAIYDTVNQKFVCSEKLQQAFLK